MKFNLNFMQDFGNEYIKILVFNIQSMSKHFMYIKNDKFFTSCDIISLNETWTKSNEIYNINDYKIISRVDSNENPLNKTYGMITLAKNSFPVNKINSTKLIDKNGKYFIIEAFILNNIIFLSIYKSNTI